MNRDQNEQREAVGAEPRPEAGTIPRIEARSLFGQGREVLLVHGTAEYRLRLTSNGKLILTK